jgi:hypothetical protein
MPWPTNPVVGTESNMAIAVAMGGVVAMGAAVQMETDEATVATATKVMALS